MRIRSVLLLATSVASITMSAGISFAQDQTAQATQTQQIEEVVVTAQKRAQNFMDVPVFENVVSEQQMQRFQTVTLADVATQVPGLKFSQSNLSVGTLVSLRGIGTNTLDAGIDQSVALNIDGMQITQGLAYSAALFDIGQVEVLKGPQALFYGKNSPGGVISVRSADPTDEFELMGTAAYEFEANEKRGELIVSGPVTDTLLLRLAAEYDKSEGYFRDPSNGGDPAFGGLAPSHRDGPEDENYIIRGTALWNPISDLTTRFKLTYSHDLEQVLAGEEEIISCPDGNTPGPLYPFLGAGPCKPSRDWYQPMSNPALFPNPHGVLFPGAGPGGSTTTVYGPGVPYNGVPTAYTNQLIGTMEVNYNIAPEIALTSDTGFYYAQYQGMIDTPFSDNSAGNSAAINHYNHHELTEELRVNTSYSGPLNFTGGLFYQWANVSDQTAILINSAYGFPGFDTLWNTQYLTDQTYSAYGQVRWNILPKLEFDLGGRFTDEQRHDTPYIDTYCANFEPGCTASGLTSGIQIPVSELGGIQQTKLKSDNFSPEGTLTYKATDDLTFYGSVKKGFKSGSFDITNFPAPGSQLAYNPEKAYGGELGMKSRWFDRTLQVNLSIYDYRYDDLQVGATENTNGGPPNVVTLNAASANVHGVDFDTTWVPPIDGLEVHAAVEWNEAHFLSFKNAPCWGGQTYAEGCNEFYAAGSNFYFGPAMPGFSPGQPFAGYTAQNLSGAALQRAPEWQISQGVSYELPVMTDKSLVIASENQFSSGYWMLLSTRPDFWQRAYFETDLSLTLKGPDDHWEVALIGKNLSDVLTTDQCSSYNDRNGYFGGQYQGLGGPGAPAISGQPLSGPAGRDVLACIMDRGPEVWIRLTYRPFE